MSTIPASPADEIIPVYTDLVDNWRAVDAHWYRNRVVHVFDDAAERTAKLTSPTQGMVTYLKTTDSLEVRKASAWESVRYPNMVVASDATTVSLRQKDAGAGLILRADGSVGATVLTVANPASTGMTLDATGLAIKVGTKIAKIATDATNLIVDSPVKVTGDIESSAAVKGVTGTFTGTFTAAAFSTAGALTAASLNVSGTVNAGLLNVGNAEVAIDTALAVFRHKSSPTNRLSFDNTGAAILKGASVSVQGPTTFPNAVTMTGTAEFQGGTTLHPAGTTAAPVAGIKVANTPPTAGDTLPNGTLWVVVG